MTEEAQLNSIKFFWNLPYNKRDKKPPYKWHQIQNPTPNPHFNTLFTKNCINHHYYAILPLRYGIAVFLYASVPPRCQSASLRYASLCILCQIIFFRMPLPRFRMPSSPFRMPSPTFFSLSPTLFFTSGKNFTPPFFFHALSF